MTDFLPLNPAASGPPTKAQTQGARDAARALEVSFLTEMLKSAGVGEQTSAFAGGVGENQFAMFQRHALAEDMVENGRIGLSEHIFKSLMEAQNEQ